MALREVLPIPVVGMTEAALMSACMLGQRFSIIAISSRMSAWYRECVDSYGLLGRLVSLRCLDRPLRDLASIQQEHRDALLALATQAVQQDGADVIVLAGAPLAGLARRGPAASRRRRASRTQASARRWQPCSNGRAEPRRKSGAAASRHQPTSPGL